MITFTRSWHGYAAGTSVSTLADTIEALAVAEGAATYGGASYPLNSFLDADNRTQALVDGAGISRPLGSPALRNTVILAGDSITARSWKQISLTHDGIVNNGDGTATAAISTAPNSTTNQVSVGDTVRIFGSATPLYNQLAAVVTAVSNTPAYSITYTITGAYADTPFTEAPTMIRYQRLSVRGWWTFFQKLANATFDVVADCTQGGTQIRYVQQMLERQYPAASARFGIFHCGINDIYVGSRTLAEMQADTISLLGAMSSRVQVLLAFTIPAMSASKAGWTLARANQVAQYNKWLASYVPTIGGAVIDSNTAASNGVTYGSGSDTNGAPNTGMVSDFTHPTALGAYALAKAAYAKAAPFIVQDARWPSSAIDGVYYDAASKYLLDASHVLLTGTGGGKTAGSGTITGNVPTGCTLAWVTSGSGLTATLTSPARTVAADGDTVGNNFAIALSGTAGAVSLLRFSVTATLGRFSFGDVIRAIARIKLTAPVGIQAINTVARVVQASMARYDSAGMEETDGSLTEGAMFYEFTPWIPLLAGNGALSSVTFMIDIWIDSGAVTGGTVISIAHPNIERA